MYQTWILINGKFFILEKKKKKKSASEYTLEASFSNNKECMI